MEVAGFAVSAFALAGLFNNAVDCFEYVQIGKAFEQDLSTCLLRIATARLKLSRWGHAIGIQHVTTHESFLRVQCNPGEVELAQGILQQIIELFKAAEERSVGLLKRSRPDQLALIDPHAIEQSPVSRVTSYMRNVAILRTSKAGLTAKTKWALYQKGQFTGLVDSISDLVNELINIFPAVQDAQPALCLEEATGLCSDSSNAQQVDELQRVTADSDPDLAAAIEAALKERAQQSTHHNNVNFSGTFHGQSQNIGVLYGNPTFDGKARDVWPTLPAPSEPSRAVSPNVTIMGQFENSNIIGYINSLTLAPDSLPNSVWTIPRAVNSLFIGRQEIAATLESAFADSKQTSGFKPKTFVIIGLGGMGKSEVAIKYAFDSQKRYWGVFWIDCQNEATAKECFELVGTKCHIKRPTIESVKSWLCSTDKQWLLLIDNADDPKQDYNRYLPAIGSGHIIITTRLQDCETYQNVGVVHLTTLTKSVARELLFNAAHIEQEDRTTQVASADRVLDELAFHTLAIIHAGSYIRRYCSIAEYLELFAKQYKSLLNAPLGQEDSTYKTVFATFEASTQKLEALRLSTKVEQISQSQASDALDLLHIMAFMHNTGSYEMIFSRARTATFAIETSAADIDQDSVDNLTAHHASFLRPFYPSEKNDVKLRIRWRQAYKALQGFSFVTVTGEGQATRLSMHQLVHMWARERQSVERKRLHWQTAASAICLSSPTQRVDIIWTPTVHSFTPVVQDHALVCAMQATDELLQSSPGLSNFQLLFHLTWLNFESNNKNAFEKCWSILRAMKSFITGCSEENELPYKEFQGHLYWREHFLPKAVQEFEEYLDLARAHKWAEERTLRVQRNLARIYQLNRQHDKAVPLLEHVREVQETLKYDHPDRLGSLRLLAELYIDYHQFEKAAPILEYIVFGQNDFVQHHAEFFWARLDLANVYEKIGQSHKSVKVLEPLFELKGGEELKMAAEEHLIKAYIADGQGNKAIAKLQRAVSHEKLSSAYPLSLSIAYDINYQVNEALCDHILDNPTQQAEKLLEHIIQLSQKRFSDQKIEGKHPTVHKYEILLARVYLAQGMDLYVDAIGLLEELAVAEVQSKDWDHQSSVDIRWLLARAYLAAGQRRQASLCLEHLCKVQSRDGADHIQRKFPVIVDIADDLCAEGLYDAATDMYTSIADILEGSRYERDILLRLDVRCKLGMALKHAGYLTKALDSLWKDFSFEIACLPADHPTQIATHYAYVQVLNAVQGTNIVTDFTPEVNYGW